MGKAFNRARQEGQWLHRLADILMVLLWAAMVPSALWLGVAAGF